MDRLLEKLALLFDTADGAGTIDFLIAQIAIEHKLRLLHSDRDFTKKTTVVNNLKLA